VDLGVDVTRRKLGYEGGAGGLLGFSADAIVSPAVRVEVSPLAGSPDRWYAGLTAFGAYAHSVGLQTESAGTKRDTAYSRLELGAGYRFRPVSSARTTLHARASYRTLSVEVSPRGAIPALPDADLAGPSLGLDLEAPLGDRFALLAGGSYTRWLTARDLVTDAWFPDGSAWAVDASAGVSVILRRSFSLRLLAAYDRTQYSLSSATYPATGASDAYLGFRAVARAEF
jgi:hypothetical protein